MNTVDLFVMGKLPMDQALLCAATGGEGRVQICLTLRYDDVVMGVRDGDSEPVFTHVPVGLRAGIAGVAQEVFRALDALPAPAARLSHQCTNLPLASAIPSSNAQPALVQALTALVKEGVARADS